MAEKKEILDYLRNKQKAQEIDAKVNGINIWVLLGALALVLWQLIATLNAPIWSQYPLLLRALMLTEAVFLLTLFTGKFQSASDEIRYRAGTEESSFEWLFAALMFLTPAGLFGLLVERSWSAMVLLFIGAALTADSVISIVSSLFKGSGKSRKFPKPSFGVTRLLDARISFAVIGLFIAVVVDQAWRLSREFSLASIPVDSVKVLTLLAAAFLLLLIAVRRRLRTAGVSWTYEMETAIVIGALSAEEALRRIEYRALGPRVKDVMEEFITDIEKRFLDLSSMIANCQQELTSVNEIPAAYQAERLSRINAIAAQPQEHLDKLRQDIAEFSDYLKKLASPTQMRVRPDLFSLLESLKLKHENYQSRAEIERKALESSISVARPQ